PPGRRDEAERDRRRARAETAGARDPVRPVEAQALRRAHEPEGADPEVRGVGGVVGPLADLDLVPEVERGGRAVEPRPEVRGRRRRADPHRRSAASGSFRPWPVSTATTRPPGRTRATPAMPAADAGSQNRPSSRA